MGSASTSMLTCTGSNQPSYVIHAEADINEVDCGTPPTVSNAMKTQLDGDTQYGARVRYNCNTGYNINGNDIISCLLNGSWSLPTPSCSLVNCSNPGEPANGYTNDNVFTYQSTVQYHCNEGYQLSGDSSIECTANSNWNNTLPNCALINCTNPGTPTNGARTGVNFFYNSTVSYSCKTGYNLTGAASITCNATGLWSAPAPSCPPVNCGDPGTPDDGSKSSNVYTYNSVVSFQCNSGYSLSGSVSLICLSNGSWNGSVPSCLAGCSDPGVPENGQRQSETFSIDSAVSFTCDTGYTLTGSNSLLCLAGGSWNDTAPTCNPVSCGDPGTPTNGTRNGTVFTFNSTVLYSCDTGYTITGAPFLTCLSNGSWNASVPSCDIVNCDDPGEPTNGMLQGGAFTYNSVVTYNCSVGYSLTGAVSLTCLADGTWNESVPSCDIVK
ncbi:PREDICTED: CUB and sushi domain-containing protein 1-like, partial [Amphimedon queenslandica]|uniref:Sushi domain-containing protein n=2 Tax=Amphimedon queenslandica TaxID=400682 RepID=A0AAN0IJR4_AMPQE